MPKLRTSNDLAFLREQLREEREARPTRITLSSGTCGQAAGASAVHKALKAQLSSAGLEDRVHLRVTGCHGFCQQEPLVVLEPLGVLYCRVKVEDVSEIVSKSMVEGEIIDRLLFVDPV